MRRTMDSLPCRHDDAVKLKPVPGKMHASAGVMPDRDATQEQTSGPLRGSTLAPIPSRICPPIIAKSYLES
jgi:hypothetical protein